MPKKVEMNETQKELFRELTKLSKRANQRIVRVERMFGKDTWGIKRLRNKLDIEPLQAWTSAGRVRVNKKMSITQLRATIKATKQFLAMESSTISGIRNIRQRQIEGIRRQLSNDDINNITYEEAESLYDLFEDTDFTFFVPKYFTASEFWALIEEAKEMNYSENEFVSLIRNYIEFGNDLDMLMRIRAIYNKYVLD